MSDDHFRDIGGGVSVVVTQLDPDPLEERAENQDKVARRTAFDNMSKDLARISDDAKDPMTITPTSLSDNDPHLDFFLKNKD
jgi:hypothetical protein